MSHAENVPMRHVRKKKTLNGQNHEKNMEQELARIIRQEPEPDRKQKPFLLCRMSVPSILSQITSIIMQYIDAAMVGGLGAAASASIGVVSTSTWLLSGLCSAVSTGFSVQSSHQIGAGNKEGARNVLRHGMITAILISSFLALFGASVSTALPVWLKADPEIREQASGYFLVFACSLPFVQMNSICSLMLQSSGNMRTPSILNASMCLLDVGFNWIFIRHFGVIGAALGTAMAEVTIACIMIWEVFVKSPVYRCRKGEKHRFDAGILSRAFRLGVPMGFEHLVVCGAMIVTTRIIAPIGTTAVAANSFAVTAESFCYMPGYGIAAAISALVGQSLGAGKKKLAKSFSNMAVLSGAAVMGIAGGLMFFLCPFVFQILTPDLQVRKSAVEVLRIELFAEPLYGVSIVAAGALRGAGDSLIPSLLNLISIWGVRISLSVMLAGRWGLRGVWAAMAVELCVRGLLLLIRQQRKL